MTENNNNRRDELCGRFRDYISGKSQSNYFDEDDLIEIFDFAGDLNDDYLRMEALLYGARYYPESDGLKQRRALLYYTFGDDLTTKYLQDNATQSGVLWEIIRIRNANPAGADAEKSLDGLLSTYTELDDEEVIQLVDLASSLGQTDWLLSRLEALRAHVSYLPTLLYEIAVMLEMDQRYDEAIKLLEELTDLEPYNDQYWFMLAQEYDLNGDAAGALQALDMAMAILPADKAMKFYHARLLARDDGSLAQAVESLEKLSAQFPDDADISRFLAALYIDHANDSQMEPARRKAVKVLKSCYQLNTGNRQLASDLMATDAEPSDKLIAEVDHLNPPASQSEWVSWAEDLSNLGAYNRAIDILRYCQCKYGDGNSPVNESLIVNYFMIKDFASVCSIFETKIGKSAISSEETAALLFVIYATSLAKSGRYAEAANFSDMALRVVVEDVSSELSNSLRRLGAGLVLTDIVDRCTSRDHTDWASYDPLGAWSVADNQ